MFEFTVEKLMDAPLDSVWSLVSDFANLEWYDGVSAVEQVGEGIGQIRRLSLPGMDHPVDEQLLALDEGEHRIEYQVLEGPVSIMRDYRVRASLLAEGRMQTRALWQASFSGVTIDGVQGQDMVAVMRETYARMLDSIEQAAGAN